MCVINIHVPWITLREVGARRMRTVEWRELFNTSSNKKETFGKQIPWQALR